MWDRVGCQFLSGTEVCVAVSLWQGDWGGGRLAGINMIKDTNAEPHRKSKRKGEEPRRAPHIPSPPSPPSLRFPITTPMEEMNHN